MEAVCVGTNRGWGSRGGMRMVPQAGLEPARCEAKVFKTRTSTIPPLGQGSDGR